MHSISFHTSYLLSHIVYVLQVHTKIFLRVYIVPVRAQARSIYATEKKLVENFLKKTIDILQHVWYNTSCQEDIGKPNGTPKKSWKKFLTYWVICDRMSTTKQGTRLTTERAFELTVRVGRATCQVIPLCPPTCVCTLHGSKSTVCMHGGHTDVHPPTRTQGKAENTKNFFLTYWAICVRIKLHRTAKATRWTAKAEKLYLTYWVICGTIKTS